MDRAGFFSRIPSKMLSVQPIVFPTLTKNHTISFKKGGDATPYYLDQKVATHLEFEMIKHLLYLLTCLKNVMFVTVLKGFKNCVAQIISSGNKPSIAVHLYSRKT